MNKDRERLKEKLKEAFYHLVGEEINNNYFNPDVEAKAIAEARGDERLVLNLYIKFRVEQLLEKHTERWGEEEKLEKETREQLEKKRLLTALIVLIILAALVQLIANTPKHFLYP